VLRIAVTSQLSPGRHNIGVTGTVLLLLQEVAASCHLQQLWQRTPSEGMPGMPAAYLSVVVQY
jgi:hypothetical protein